VREKGIAFRHYPDRHKITIVFKGPADNYVKPFVKARGGLSLLKQSKRAAIELGYMPADFSDPAPEALNAVI
jgi:hypothetical protein